MSSVYTNQDNVKKKYLKKKSHTKSQFNAYCLLSCRDKSTLICFCLCRHTVTLPQGSGHRNVYDYEDNYMPWYKSAVMLSLNAVAINTVRDIAIMLQIKHFQV